MFCDGASEPVLVAALPRCVSVVNLPEKPLHNGDIEDTQDTEKAKVMYFPDRLLSSPVGCFDTTTEFKDMDLLTNTSSSDRFALLLRYLALVSQTFHRFPSSRPVMTVGRSPR